MSSNITISRWLIGCGVFLAIIGTGVPATAQGLPSGFSASAGGFVENRGQWDAAAVYRASFGPLDVWLQRDGWTLAVEEREGLNPGPRGFGANDPVPTVTTRGTAVRMRFDGSAGGRAAGVGPLEARLNWISGDDSSRWVTDVRAFREVRLAEVYPGVSAVAREEQGRFEYDLVVEPGADAGVVRFVCKGQDSLFVDAHGALVMRTRHGDLRHTAPIAWMEGAAGSREPVSCAWTVTGGDGCAFVTGARDPSRRLVIDPGIIWSTLFGGALDEDPSQGALAVSAGGNINLAGVAISTTFPTTLGAYQTVLQGAGSWDAFVSRFSPSGSLLWSTYLGGDGYEWARDVAVGPNDTLVVVGSTSSSNFPSVAPFDPIYNGTGPTGWGDAFLCSFNPAFSGPGQLTWCTILGGSSDDRLNSVAVDANGIVTAAGWSYSFNCPGITPPNAFQLFQGGQDGMVCRFNPALVGSAQLLWFTFLGGGSNDYLGRVALGPAGRVLVQGGSWSANFPVASPLQMTFGGGPWDSTVSVLDPALSGASQLAYSTYLGGTGDEIERGIAIDGAGRITVAGWTSSSNFVTSPGAYDTTFNSGYDAFVTRINPALPPASQLVFSTFIGGSADDGVNDMILDASGGVRMAGSSGSNNFPTTPGSFQPVFQGGGPPPPTGFGPYDGFVATLSPSGAALWYSSYLGGSASYDFAYSVEKDTCGGLIVAGLTRASNFPHTSGVYQSADDVFLLRLEALPTGATRYGFPTAGCSGPPEIIVNSMPQNGNASFQVACLGAPPSSAAGLLGVSGAPLASPLFVSGLAVFIDPSSPVLFTLGASSDALGAAILALPLPAGPGFVGVTGFLQFGWPDPCAPGGLSGTCGMQLTIP